MIDFSYTILSLNNVEPHDLKESVKLQILMEIEDEYARALIVLDEIRETVKLIPTILEKL